MLLYKYKQFLEGKITNKHHEKILDDDNKRYHGFDVYNKNKTSEKQLKQLKQDNLSNQEFSNKAYENLVKVHSNNPTKLKELEKNKEFEDKKYESRNNLISKEITKRQIENPPNLVTTLVKNVLPKSNKVYAKTKNK